MELFKFWWQYIQLFDDFFLLLVYKELFIAAMNHMNLNSV